MPTTIKSADSHALASVATRIGWRGQMHSNVIQTQKSLLIGFTLVAICPTVLNSAAADELVDAVSLYASFDEAVQADVGGGDLKLRTRVNHPIDEGKYVFEKGYPPLVFQIAKDKGVSGGALDCTDVLDRRGRIFFPARGNIAFRDGGWGGAVSMWLNTDPNRLLKTPFCDPVQITAKGAHDGGIWIDFPDIKPREMRMGVFPALAAGQPPLKESDPQAAIVRMKNVPFESGEWHHVAMSWSNFDTGKPDASAQLYVDGKLVGELTDREIAMKWDIDKVGIYIAVNYIGLFDDFAVFGRPITANEVAQIFQRHALWPLSAAPKRDRAKARTRAVVEFGNVMSTLQRFPRRAAKLGDEEAEAIRKRLLELVKEPHGLGELLIGLLLQIPPRDDDPPSPPKFPFDVKSANRYQNAYAQWAGLPLEFINRAGITMRLIPPGTFQMGSPPEQPGHGHGGRDETLHEVRLTRPFYLAKHEVTVGQFQSFVAATNSVTDGERNGGGNAHDERGVWKHRDGTQWRNPGYAGPFVLLDSLPVVHASLNDARRYCDWLNQETDLEQRQSFHYTLPTEPQWEWACRAGSAGRFWWGDEVDETGRRLNVGDRFLKQVHPEWPRETMPMNDGHAFPAPVGSYAANAFGLHDMLGNVWEFCSTPYGPYLEKPPIVDSRRSFAVRGGGWSNEPHDARCATRNADPPTFCHSNLGFRVALEFQP